MDEQSDIPPRDSAVIQLFKDRDGMPTLVALPDGVILTVHNIGWGYDIGDSYAHVSTNVSPTVEGSSFDILFTDEIARMTDPAGQVLYENPSALRRAP